LFTLSETKGRAREPTSKRAVRFPFRFPYEVASASDRGLRIVITNLHQYALTALVIKDRANV